MKQPVHKICPQTLHSPPFSLRGEGPLLVPTGLPNIKRHGNIHPDKTAGILRHWGRAHPNDKWPRHKQRKIKRHYKSLFRDDGPVRKGQFYYDWSTRRPLHNQEGNDGINSASIPSVRTPDRGYSRVLCCFLMHFSCYRVPFPNCRNLAILMDCTGVWRL